MDTKHQLAKAFVELMDRKPIDQIRVVEIAQAAGFSKQTFYHHFVDKYDLMSYCFRKMFERELAMLAQGEPYERCNEAFFDKCRERSDFMHNAFSSSDVNGLFRAMRYIVREAASERVQAQGARDEGDIAFMLDFYAKGFVGATRRWLERGQDLPQKELERLLVLCLPMPIACHFK